MRQRLVRALALSTELIVAALAIGSVWPFGSVHPFFQWIMFAGIGALLVTWGVRVVLEGRPLWKLCPVVFCGAALCCLSLFSIVPLPRSWVAYLSPESITLREALLPTAEETGYEQAPELTGTLSLAPGVTRIELFRLFGVFALFAVVRNNLLDPGAFYRLSWMMVANGVVLALFGMGQMTSSPRNVVFWSIETSGQVFGPFVCRNHAAYYLNLCLGLAGGLLLGTRFFMTENSSWRGMFRDARVLWLICGIGVMLAGLLATLSRGGLIGLGISTLACLMLLVFRYGNRTPWFGAALILALTAGLIFWQGTENITQRWEKIGGQNSAPEARAAVWMRSLPLIKQFPIWGSGLGTFGMVEQMCRKPGDTYHIFNDHAHNDFLELWIEGGTISLLFALVAILLIFRKGYLAFVRFGNTGLGRLALGALIAFSAIVIHSFIDFGLHIPAVAVLAAVVGAMLMNLSELPTDKDPKPAVEPSTFGTGLLASFQAGALFAVAWFLVRVPWDDQQAERYRWASISATAIESKIAYLAAATEYAPDRADLFVALADRHIERYLAHRTLNDLVNIASVLGGADGIDGLSVLGFSHPPFIPRYDRDIDAANSLLLKACQLNPVFYDAQERLERISTMGTFRNFKGRRLDRLVFLSPSDPAPWFWVGRQALQDGDRAKAIGAFRNSLTANPQFLPEIAKFVPENISYKEFLTDVLPSNPELILEATKELEKESGPFAGEKDYLQSALALLLKLGDQATGDEMMTRARVHAALQENAGAENAYEAALARSPMNYEWRFEFGRYLLRQSKFEEAARQLKVVINLSPPYWSWRAEADLKNAENGVLPKE